ncbi:MAG: hypothetical protein E5X37_34750, partial [Mesorhizobium sp.]|uniref:hypothetical protein n=1 Tax=Mesorhizobium sp. TaxID=1871066 RepID=UPI001218C9EC
MIGRRDHPFGQSRPEDYDPQDGWKRGNGTARGQLKCCVKAIKVRAVHAALIRKPAPPHNNDLSMALKLAIDREEMLDKILS